MTQAELFEPDRVELPLVEPISLIIYKKNQAEKAEWHERRKRERIKFKNSFDIDVQLAAVEERLRKLRSREAQPARVNFESVLETGTVQAEQREEPHRVLHLKRELFPYQTEGMHMNSF